MGVIPKFLKTMYCLTSKTQLMCALLIVGTQAMNTHFVDGLSIFNVSKCANEVCQGNVLFAGENVLYAITNDEKVWCGKCAETVNLDPEYFQAIYYQQVRAWDDGTFGVKCDTNLQEEDIKPMETRIDRELAK